MNNDIKRILTSLFLLPLLILIVYIGQGMPFNVLVIICIFICLQEFYRLMEKGGISCFKSSGFLLGLGIPLAFISKSQGLMFFTVIFSIIIIFLKTLVSACSSQSLTIQNLCGSILGVLYIPIMLSFLIPIRGLRDGEYLIFCLLTIIWLNDTLAYYTGSLIGKNPLCQKVSPKKTVEGTLGGLAGSTFAALLFRALWLPNSSLCSIIMLGIVIGIFSQLGDLCESMIKRWAKAKDSGSILPGHGGLLDRIDGLIFSAPVFYYYSVFILFRL